LESLERKVTLFNLKPEDKPEFARNRNRYWPPIFKLKATSPADLAKQIKSVAQKHIEQANSGNIKITEFVVFHRKPVFSGLEVGEFTIELELAILSLQ
jgi:hypothetical protein